MLDNWVAVAPFELGIEFAHRKAVMGLQNVPEDGLEVFMLEEQRPQESGRFFPTAVDHVMVTVGQQPYGTGRGHGLAPFQRRADYHAVLVGKGGEQRKGEVGGMKQLVLGQVKQHLVRRVAARFKNPNLILS